MAKKQNDLMEKIVSLCKRRGPVKFLTGQGITSSMPSVLPRGAALFSGGVYGY